MSKFDQDQPPATIRRVAMKAPAPRPAAPDIPTLRDAAAASVARGFTPVHSAAADAPTLNSGATPWSGSATPGSGSGSIRLQPGDQIESYVIEKFVGNGAMGAVYKASSAKFPNRVALKVLDGGSCSSYDELVEEATRQARLSGHTNVVQIMDIGEVPVGRPHAGLRYLVMEFVAGAQLNKFQLNSLGPPVKRLSLFTQVATAIGYAHTEGIVHRDLKPANIMITLDPRFGVVKVVDFGIAVAISKSAVAQDGAPKKHYVCGTPGYIRRGRIAAGSAKFSVEPADDVYALGVTLYQLIAGFTQHPYGWSESPSAPYIPLTAAADLEAELLAPLNALLQAATEGGGGRLPPANGDQFCDALDAILKAHEEAQQANRVQIIAKEVEEKANRQAQLEAERKRRQFLGLFSSLIGLVLGGVFGSVGWMSQQESDRTERATAHHVTIAAEFDEANKSAGLLPSELKQKLLKEISVPLVEERPVAKSLLRYLIRDLLVLPGAGASCGPEKVSESDELIDLSPDGRLALLKLNNEYVLWNCQKNQERTKLPLWQPFNAASDKLIKYFSADGKWFLGAPGAADKHTACRWTTESPAEPASCVGPLALNIERVMLSRDGQTVLLLAKGAGAQLWDFKERRRLHDLTADLSGISTAALSTDGSVVTAGGMQGQILSWQRVGQTYRKLQSSPLQLDERKGAVQLLALSADNRRVVASYGGHTLWYTATYDPHPKVSSLDLSAVAGLKQPKVTAVSFDGSGSDSCLLAGLQSGGAVRLPIAEQGERLPPELATIYSEQARPIEKLWLSADGETVFGASFTVGGITAWARDGTKLWELGGKKLLAWLGTVIQPSGGEAVTLALWSAGRSPQLWSPKRGNQRCSPVALAQSLEGIGPLVPFSEKIQACFAVACEDPAVAKAPYCQHEPNRSPRLRYLILFYLLFAGVLGCLWFRFLRSPASKSREAPRPEPR